MKGNHEGQYSRRQPQVIPCLWDEPDIYGMNPAALVILHVNPAEPRSREQEKSTENKADFEAITRAFHFGVEHLAVIPSP